MNGKWDCLDMPKEKNASECMVKLKLTMKRSCGDVADHITISRRSFSSNTYIKLILKKLPRDGKLIMNGKWDCLDMPKEKNASECVWLI